MYQVLRNKAISLRKKGYSYNLIKSRVPVSKSTLTNWLQEIPYTPNKIVRDRIAKNLLKFVLRTTRRRLKSIKAIRHEMKKKVAVPSERDLFMFGLGVYLGEGTKTFSIMRIINADPRVIRLSIIWLQKVFKVPKENFVLRVFLYPDSNVKKVFNYWSRITGLSKKQFYKPQIDIRTNKSGKKHNKLPYGTAHIGVKSFDKAEFGVQLQRRILSSIDAVFESFGIMQR